ncbi:MAG: GIY-YIG nuclease family protein [Candidatus Desulfofervidaceae bacterium]|nr:GIY-YIG nuclease family protein [Candidatus Desulfofervidaceae bacterium]
MFKIHKNITFNLYPNTAVCPEKDSDILTTIINHQESFVVGFKNLYLCGEFCLLSPKVPRDLWMRLKRINTRNRMTYEIINALLKLQKQFLISGKNIDLCPLSKTFLSNFLKNPSIDPSRISRLLKQEKLCLPDGQIISFAQLFPSKRDIISFRVYEIISKEKLLGSTQTDKDIVFLLKNRYGLNISRREVCKIRKKLSIPTAWVRNKDNFLGVCGKEFSPPFYLQQMTSFPEIPGVYIIRLLGKQIKYPKGLSDIIYIGSSNNLGTRLMTHLIRSKNPILKKYIEKTPLFFSYLALSERWREVEREIFFDFTKLFGTSPLGNRLTP